MTHEVNIDALVRARDAFDARGYVVVEDLLSSDFISECREEFQAIARCVSSVLMRSDTRDVGLTA